MTSARCLRHLTLYPLLYNNNLPFIHQNKNEEGEEGKEEEGGGTREEEEPSSSSSSSVGATGTHLPKNPGGLSPNSALSNRNTDLHPSCGPCKSRKPAPAPLNCSPEPLENTVLDNHLWIKDNPPQ